MTFFCFLFVGVRPSDWKAQQAQQVRENLPHVTARLAVRTSAHHVRHDAKLAPSTSTLILHPPGNTSPSTSPLPLLGLRPWLRGSVRSASVQGPPTSDLATTAPPHNGARLRPPTRAKIDRRKTRHGRTTSKPTAPMPPSWPANRSRPTRKDSYQTYSTANKCPRGLIPPRQPHCAFQLSSASGAGQKRPGTAAPVPCAPLPG